jgi:hypothetical protein
VSTMTPEYRYVNPTGSYAASRLDESDGSTPSAVRLRFDKRSLTRSSAILCWFAMTTELAQRFQLLAVFVALTLLVRQLPFKAWQQQPVCALTKDMEWSAPTGKLGHHLRVMLGPQGPHLPCTFAAAPAVLLSEDYCAGRRSVSQPTPSLQCAPVLGCALEC